MRCLSLLLMAACLAFAPEALAADRPGALEGLGARAALIDSLQSDFVQETSIPMFERPVVSRGRLLFQRPETLRWEYLEPLKEGFAILGDQGVRWTDDVRTPFSPGDDPTATLVAGQLVAWISFDLASIEREYSIEILGEQPLSLKMTPRSAGLAGVIKSISIDFADTGAASLVRLEETQGGSTTIVFSHTVLNQPLADGEFQ